jgi:hypothetical protein
VKLFRNKCTKKAVLFFSSAQACRGAGPIEIRKALSAFRSALRLLGVYEFSVAEMGVILCKWGKVLFWGGGAGGVEGNLFLQAGAFAGSNRCRGTR